MTKSTIQEAALRPLRAAVFSNWRAADKAVQQLLSAGFSEEEVTVVCSDAAKERHFREFEHQQPAGANTPAAATTGGVLGAALGGATAVATGIAAGGLPLAIMGSAGLLTGGAVGSFLGAMMTRGVEKEAANYYDQAVEQGNLLVTVELHDPRAEPSLATAERILADAGAEPLPLLEG